MKPTTIKCRRGMDWHLFGVEFESPDGKFTFHIYALSFEHAQLQLDAIKETAVIYGQIDSFIPFDKPKDES